VVAAVHVILTELGLESESATDAAVRGLEKVR
jgi:hypothetical protein